MPGSTKKTAKKKTKRSRTGNNAPSRYSVPNLDRALGIIELLSRHPSGLTRAQICDATGLSTNIVYRIASTLTERGFLSRDPQTKRFRNTSRLLELGCTSMDEHCVAELSWQPMKDLRDLTGETVFLSVLARDEGVVIEQVSGLHEVRIFVDKGHRFPLHGGAPGKSLLAFLPPDEARAIIGAMAFKKFTENTVTSRREFEGRLRRVRENGYSVDHAEVLHGVNCVAAPIRDERGVAVASICVTAPADRMPEKRFGAISKLVMSCAAGISEKLGYREGRSTPGASSLDASRAAGSLRVTG
jgi:DNA-binding IclR family transcriptional regulator